ncbi:Hypothetical predicted protein [Olea europaea subsp. europaea]|uniref:COP9 signalosome complex subunit 7 n=1 Tax=Olea europaea subsp. europaea TaxID=158383 RepID=A0A8S0SIK5_OLEEU|nr:Hypothetical predicted protein [Olea europaea subsp. europaea]
MDIEQKQAEHIDYFVKQASNLKGSALRNVIVEATSHPSLFAFAEILSVPNILELQGTENAVFLDLLRVFAHGTWSEYKSVASRLPPLVPDQVLKLKQLTVLTLAETNKGNDEIKNRSAPSLCAMQEVPWFIEVNNQTCHVQSNCPSSLAAKLTNMFSPRPGIREGETILFNYYPYFSSAIQAILRYQRMRDPISIFDISLAAKRAYLKELIDVGRIVLDSTSWSFALTAREFPV